MNGVGHRDDSTVLPYVFLHTVRDARACAIMHRDESLMMRFGNERCFQQKKQADVTDTEL